jgi:hypothetical protein
MNGPQKLAAPEEEVGRKDPIGLRRILASRSLRQRAGWAAVLIGGGLQYAYTSTKHPSVALRIWSALYGIGVIICILVLIAAIGYAVRDWLRRRRGIAPT